MGDYPGGPDVITGVLSDGGRGRRAPDTEGSVTMEAGRLREI